LWSNRFGKINSKESPMNRTSVVLVATVVVACLGVIVAVGDDPKPDEPTRIAVLWSSGDADVAHRVCFMYTHNAKRSKWFDEVTLIVWGPSARLLAGDKDLQDRVKGMIRDGVKVQACGACANSYGVSPALKKIGVEVKGMGKPLSEILQSDTKVLTF